jgi:hypothetical protein
MGSGRRAAAACGSEGRTNHRRAETFSLIWWRPAGNRGAAAAAAAAAWRAQGRTGRCSGFNERFEGWRSPWLGPQGTLWRRRPGLDQAARPLHQAARLGHHRPHLRLGRPWPGHVGHLGRTAWATLCHRGGKHQGRAPSGEGRSRPASQVAAAAVPLRGRRNETTYTHRPKIFAPFDF